MQIILRVNQTKKLFHVWLTKNTLKLMQLSSVGLQGKKYIGLNCTYLYFNVLKLTSLYCNTLLALHSIALDMTNSSAVNCSALNIGWGQIMDQPQGIKWGQRALCRLVMELDSICSKAFHKNPGYGRQSISRPMRIVASLPRSF